MMVHPVLETIPDLPAAEALSAGDLFVVSQGGAMRNVTWSVVSAGNAGGGTSSTNTLVLSATVSGGMAVSENSGGAFPASSDTVADALLFVGIAQQSGNAGGAINVVQYGPITETAWSWSAGPIFLGLNGALTQTPPTTGALLQIGHAISATSIFINPSQIYQL